MQMKNLSFLVISLCHSSISYDFVLDLFKNLKHLAFFQVTFIRPSAGYSKDELSMLFY